MPTAAELIRLDKARFWHPFTQMADYLAEEPLIVERGEGSYLVDTDGRRYLDGVSSLWVTVHGHRKAELDAAGDLYAMAAVLYHLLTGVHPRTQAQGVGLPLPGTFAPGVPERTTSPPAEKAPSC